ncbi:MAG: Swarming motility protein SwrC [Firmicutes bacterium]|nr:Swarming motility protein SwrC [Bacillota bacterium]
MSGGGNVQINVSGPSLEGLRLHTDRLKEMVAAVEGVTEVRDNAAVGANELVVRVDREKATRLGLAPVSIAQAVRTAFQGETVARLPRDGRELDVNVSLADSARQSVTDLENLVVAVTQGQVVRLKQVAVIEHGVGPASINRRANQRYISITGTIAGRDLQSVSRDLQVKLDALELPADYRVEIAGDMMEMQEAFSGLITALILAVVLVYMVMAAQFESLLYPLIVMFTMPLAVIGVLFALFFAGQSFNVPSVMGVIVLAGIVVSIAIIGGLTVSTLLTLYVIPVAYDLATLRRREA